MKKYCFLLDTSSDSDGLNIHEDSYVIPFGVIIGSNGQDKLYDDWYGISREEILDALDKGYDVKTSQAPFGIMYEKVEQLLKEYEKVVIFTITKEFSGTYQTYLNIKKQIEDSTGDKERILVVDSRGLGYMQNMAIETVKKGMDMNKSFAEIEKAVKNLISSYCGFTCITNAIQLVKGGRLKGLKAILVKALNLKLIIKYQDGKLDYQDKSLNLFGAMDKGIEMLRKELCLKKNKIKKLVFFSDLKDQNETIELMKYVKMKLNDFDNYEVIENKKFPAAIVAHLGNYSFSVLIVIDKKLY